MEKKYNVFNTFERIKKEYISKVEKYKKLEEEAAQNQYQNEIANKMIRINNLRQEVENLKEMNEEYHETLSQYKLQKFQYENMAGELNHLSEQIEKKIKNSYTINADDIQIPDEKIEEINQKIDQIIEIISNEYTPIQVDEINKEEKRLREKKKALERKIRLLKLFPVKDYNPIDSYDDVAIEECEMRYSPEHPLDFQSFSSISFSAGDKPPNLMENCYVPIRNSIINIEKPKEEVNKYIQDQIDQSKFINMAYEKQSDYLSALRNELVSKSLTETDINKLIISYQNQIQKLNTMPEITPIQIPEVQFSENEEQSIQAHFDQFQQSLKEIIESRPYRSISEEFLNSTAEELSIPPFEGPKNPPLVKKQVPNQELVQLYDSMKDLIERAKKVDFLHQVQKEVSEQQKKYEENMAKSPVEDRSGVSHDEDEFFKVPPPLDPPPENLTTIAFKELVKSKLPEMFFDAVDLPDFDMKIEDLLDDNETEAAQQTETTFSPSAPIHFDQNESQISMEADQRIQLFENILKEFASFDLPPIPQLAPPPPVQVEVISVDTKPLQDKIESVLDSSEENVASLDEEIEELENKAKELTTELNLQLDEKLSTTEFSIEKVDNLISMLDLRRRLVEKEKLKAIGNAKEIKEQLQNTTINIRELQEQLDEIETTPQMIKEKEDEFKAKENEFKAKFREKFKSA